MLYLAHSLPQTHPVHKGILEFQKALETKSNGTLKVKIFPDAQLGSEREVLELLQIGSVAATKVSAAHYLILCLNIIFWGFLTCLEIRNIDLMF